MHGRRRARLAWSTWRPSPAWRLAARAEACGRRGRRWRRARLGRSAASRRAGFGSASHAVTPRHRRPLARAQLPRLGAGIAHAPVADGVAASLHAMRYQSPLAAMRLTGRGVLDAIGGLFGRKPLLVPLAAKPGTVAMLTTPDALDADRAFSSDNHSSDWPKAIAARSALRIGCYRPG